MYDDFDNWQEFRAEVHNWVREKNESIIREWLKEIGFSGTIGYDICYNGVVTIYSNRCGILIGMAGKNIDILRDILNREYPKKEWKVKFVENRGEFISV